MSTWPEAEMFGLMSFRTGTKIRPTDYWGRL